MPSGVKDWLAGKNPAHAQRRRPRKVKSNTTVVRGDNLGRSNNRASYQRGGRAQEDNRRTIEASSPSAQEVDNGIRAQKRLDQQRALDRLVAVASVAPGAPSTPPLQPSGVEDDCRTEGRGTKEDRDLDGADAIEAKPEAATGQKNGQIGEEVGLTAAGTAWLDVADLHHDGGAGAGDAPDSTLPLDLGLFRGMAEPKAVGHDGGSPSGHTWSLANSGKAAIADGEEWDITYDEADDEVEEKEDVVVPPGDGEGPQF